MTHLRKAGFGKAGVTVVLLFVLTVFATSFAYQYISNDRAQAVTPFKIFLAMKALCTTDTVKDITDKSCTEHGRHLYRWLADNVPKAVSWVSSRFGARNNSQQTMMSSLLSAPQKLKESVLGNPLDEALQDLILPEYFEMVDSLKEMRQRRWDLIDQINKLQAKAIGRENDNYRVPWTNLEVDLPLYDGGDDLLAEVKEQRKELRLINRQERAEVGKFSEFLLSRYGVKVKASDLQALLKRVDGTNILETTVMFQAASFASAQMERALAKTAGNPVLAEKYAATSIFLLDMLSRRLGQFGDEYEDKWQKRLQKIRTGIVDQIEKDKAFARDPGNLERKGHQELVGENRKLLRLVDRYQSVLESYAKKVKWRIKDLQNKARLMQSRLSSMKLKKQFQSLVRESGAQFRLITGLQSPRMLRPRNGRERNQIEGLNRQLMM